MVASSPNLVFQFQVRALFCFVIKDRLYDGLAAGLGLPVARGPVGPKITKISVGFFQYFMKF